MSEPGNTPFSRFMISLDAHNFSTPVKRIHSQNDLKRFQASPAYEMIMDFLRTLNEVVIGKANSCHMAPSENVERMLQLLEIIDKSIDDFPPTQQRMRYGNTAFRDWHQNLVQQAPILIKELLPSNLGERPGLSEELLPYLTECFGNAQRIDYGTGHENCFLLFLLCLTRVHFFSEEDKLAVVLKIFLQYMKVMRKLQKTYMLEPAGSHGVWGLDDYHFIPFIWGAAQLRGHKTVLPSSIQDKNVLEGFSAEFMYVDCIQFINEVKKGPFFEHSPMLNDISRTVPSWEKVNTGLIKMYEAEVMGKFPVIQHSLFGSLIPAP